MNYKKAPIYLCSLTDELAVKIHKEGVFGEHGFGNISSRLVIWPNKIDSDIINPKNFIRLKNHFKLVEILIIDRIIGVDKVVSIVDHVNRSGMNFLRGKTPEEKFPQFPDMSKIYSKIAEFQTVVVHTIGPERFQNQPSQEQVIWSEASGLIAPVAYYVGIEISALGYNNTESIIKFF